MKDAVTILNERIDGLLDENAKLRGALETVKEDIETLKVAHATHLKAYGEKVERLEAENQRLRAALREAMEWNWLDEDSPPPADVVSQCNKALEREE